MVGRLNIIVFILLAFISCNKNKIDGTLQTNTAWADSLRLSPDTITFSGVTFYLKADLSRDFMPQSPQNGKLLLCSNNLVEKDSLPIPSNLKLIKQYVVNGNDIWTNGYSQINNYQNFILQGIVRDGPKWGPNITVDVICEFTIGNSMFRIIAKQQEIIATF
jgi:hypothetical protein